MQCHSGCALVRIESLCKACCTSLRRRCMYDTCSSSAYHSGRICKESLASIFIRHRCAYLRRQTGGGCLVSSRRWLCRMGAIGNQPMPPTKFCLEGPHQQHDLWLSSLSVSAFYLEPTGLHEKSTRWESKRTTWTHRVSSRYAAMTEPSPVVC